MWKKLRFILDLFWNGPQVPIHLFVSAENHLYMSTACLLPFIHVHETSSFHVWAIFCVDTDMDKWMDTCRFHMWIIFPDMDMHKWMANLNLCTSNERVFTDTYRWIDTCTFHIWSWPSIYKLQYEHIFWIYKNSLLVCIMMCSTETIHGRFFSENEIKFSKGPPSRTQMYSLSGLISTL